MKNLKTLADLNRALERSLWDQGSLSDRRMSVIRSRIAELEKFKPGEALGSKRTIEEAETSMFSDDSYSRLGSIMDMEHQMEHDDWWTLLGENWSVCDNICDFVDDLSFRLWGATRPTLNLMMTPEEQGEWRRMPAEFLVYRGCYMDNSDGISWTLDRDVAVKFTTLTRYRRSGETPLLFTGWARRSRSVLLLGRGEDEVVCPMVHVVARDELDKESAAAKAAGKYRDRQPTARAKSGQVADLAAQGATRAAGYSGAT